MSKQIYRAKLHTQELIDCGFDPTDDAKDNWGIIRGILKAKGLPDWCTMERTPVRISQEPDGLMLEFS